VLHQIGNGALGPVFRAYDSDRDRLVAIKVFRLDLPPERVHQLVGEFEQLIAAELQHPVIAAPRASGIDAGNNAFLAQDFAAADTLDIVLRENGRAALANTVRVASQLADALDYAAERHVLHGALHPRDILLSQDDIRIVGMGVSRALERVGVATPVRRPYSAPERINDEGWDQRADVFSLAAIVYELLCGRRVAGTGSEAAESLTDVAGCDIEALQRVFALALAADPNYRFATATAFTTALKEAAMPDAVESQDSSEAGESKPRAKRRAKLRVVTPPTELEQTAPAEPEDLPLVIFGDELEEQMAAEPPPKVRLPRRPKVPAPTPVAIETAGQMDLAAAPPEETVETVDAIEAVDIVEVVEVVEEPPTVEQVEQMAALEMPLLDAAISPVSDEAERPPFEADPPAFEMPLEFEEPRAFEDVTITPEPRVEPEPEPVFETRLPAFLESTGAHAASSHSPVWPIGVAAVIGLAVGFGVGYTVAVRDRVATVPAAAVASAPTAVAQAPVAPKPALETPARPVETPRAAVTAPNEPPAVPVFAGRVLVRSTPPGARVFVDGKDRGQTPAAVSDLSRGEHRVRVVRDGYTSAERRVVLSPSQPIQSLTVPLAREPRVTPKQTATGVAPVATKPSETQPAGPGSLVVESRPPGATVIVDGRAVGTTPMTVGDVRAGNHSVRITLDGYTTWSASVDIKGGEQNRVTASLEK